MKCQPLLTSAAVLGLCSLATAKIDTFSPEGQPGIYYSVTVPEETVSSGSGSVLFQIRAPTTFEWVALGQGTRMAGADIFVLYSASSQNVTISPRSGVGHVQPEYNPQAEVSLLEGTGIEDGVMTANVRCDSCRFSPSSSWIFAYKGGQPLDSESPEANINFHDDFGGTSIDLSNAVTTLENPFLDYDASSPSNQPNEVGGDAGNGDTILIAHGFIMSIAFVLLFPSFGLITAIPVPGIIVKAHAPLQILALSLAIAGMGLGIKLGKDNDLLEEPHPVLGLVVLGLLILFQPAMGLLQHLHFRRTGGKSIFAHGHRWLGRVMIIVGIVNGGLGFRLAGIGNPNTPRSAVIAYSVIGGVLGLIYVAVQLFRAVKDRGDDGNQNMGGPTVQRRRQPQSDELLNRDNSC
ncbi:cytochrome and DOMON domain-containing protein [Aspergillus lucknowensis]|uniref:CBD9-like protein n=1 Tax=Aspergillus lucknowensis TaxID=176173 RepID=A0ABR4LY06_9EURO